MPKQNDFDLTGENWKKYEHIWTDSLWIINERDKTGKHSNFYHGNFVPQIPQQLIQRYTKKGDFVLDMFLGSGTTAIECENLERNIIGVDIKEELVNKAKELITSEKIYNQFICGDSKSIITRNIIEGFLMAQGKKGFELAFLHPPYDDIIKFSDKKEDLSNCETTEQFYQFFGQVLENTYHLLNKGGYFIF